MALLTFSSLDLKLSDRPPASLRSPIVFNSPHFNLLFCDRIGNAFRRPSLLVASTKDLRKLPSIRTRCLSGPRGPAIMLPVGGRRCLPSALSKRINPERRLTVFQPQGSRLRQCRLPRVISGESEDNSSIEENIIDEQTLERNLEDAIKDEDYPRATKITDRLRVLREDSKFAVISANARFYNAFKNGDLEAMHSIWAKGEHVYDINPEAGRISGYDMVMESWEIVRNSDFEFPLLIDLKNVDVHVRGDIGYVCCLEVIKTRGAWWGKQATTNVFEMINGQWCISWGKHAVSEEINGQRYMCWGKQAATNVFERINGQWFICVHHASYIDE